MRKQTIRFVTGKLKVWGACTLFGTVYGVVCGAVLFAAAFLMREGPWGSAASKMALVAFCAASGVVFGAISGLFVVAISSIRGSGFGWCTAGVLGMLAVGYLTPLVGERVPGANRWEAVMRIPFVIPFAMSAFLALALLYYGKNKGRSRVPGVERLAAIVNEASPAAPAEKLPAGPAEVTLAHAPEGRGDEATPVDDTLPDLPALQSVETRNPDALLGPAVCGSLALGMVSAAICGYQRFGTLLVARLVVDAALAVLLTLYLALRTLACVWLKVDGAGITVRSALRRRTIRWEEIRRAATSRTLTGETLLVLETDRGRTKLAPRAMGLGSGCGAAVVASVWQHLRRLGRADGIELTPLMRTLWQGIPDEVPREQQWGKPPSRAQRGLMIVVLALFPALLLLLLWNMPGPTSDMLVFLTVPCVAVTWWRVVPAALRTACQVTVDDAGLQARLPFANVSFPWSRVTVAACGARCIIVRTAAPRVEVWIPLYARSRPSACLILAIIRRLRTAGVPQPLPIPPSVPVTAGITEMEKG